MFKVLYTGGSSGGHIFPLIAVHEIVKFISLESKIDYDGFYVGSPGFLSNELQISGLKVKKIKGGKIRNYFSISNFLDPFKVFYSFFESLVYLLLIMPDVVFSKGGEGAWVVSIVAKWYNIPILMHESDAIPGKANLLTSKISTRIGLSFNESAEYFKINKDKIALIGNPVRASILAGINDESINKKSLNLDETIITLLVIGGSQGAVRLNDFILNNLKTLLREVQIIHQTGSNWYNEVVNEFEFLKSNLSDVQIKRYHPYPFLSTQNYRNALKISDCIFSRASSGAIFEIAAFNKPSILYPLKESANDHQRINAYAYARTGAAIVMEEENLLPSLFLDNLKKILYAKDVKNKMILAAKDFSRPRAAELLAKEIFELGKILI